MDAKLARRIGKRIAALRKRENLTLQAFAESVGVTHRQHVWMWERGIQMPSVQNIDAIRKRFGEDVLA